MDVEQQLSSLRRQLQQDRLRNWRSRLQSDNKEVFRWLRAKTDTHSNNIFDDELSKEAACSTSPQEALQTLGALWKRVWTRDDSQSLAPTDYLFRFGPPQTPECSWPQVTASEIFQQAKAQKHKAGGPNGWHGSEVAAWPSSMWNDLVDIFHYWERLETFPDIWQHITQVHIPKSGSARSHDQALPASRLRPI